MFKFIPVASWPPSPCPSPRAAAVPTAAPRAPATTRPRCARPSWPHAWPTAATAQAAPAPTRRSRPRCPTRSSSSPRRSFSRGRVAGLDAQQAGGVVHERRRGLRVELMTSLDDLMATFDRQREERLRMLLAIDAYNATPAERRAVIGVLFALGREALDGGYDAEVQTVAHYMIERLNAHLFMARMVERGGDARGCDLTAEGRQQTNDELLR